MTELDVAYLAGLFDGEGSVSVCHNKSRSHHVFINVAGTCEPTIRWIRDGLGYGKIHKKRCAGYKGARRPIWYFECDCAAAERFLRLVLPYLKTKRHIATLAIEFRAGGRTARKTPGACLPIRRLNRPFAQVECKLSA